MSLSNVKITSETGRTKVFIDGKQVNGIQSLKYEHSLDCFPTVKIEAMSDFDIDVEADTSVSLTGDWISVEKQLPEDEVSVLAVVKDRYGLHEEVLYRKFFEESDALYEGYYWCSYRTVNIEAMQISKVLGWQPLPDMGVFDVRLATSKT